MSRAALACVVAAAVSLGGQAPAADRVAVASLLSDPARYDGREVMVEGIASAGQWLSLTVLGNPPYQRWFPAFLLTDGPAAAWVVVRDAAPGEHAMANVTVPPPGATVRIEGIFRGASRSIEMNKPSVLVR